MESNDADPHVELWIVPEVLHILENQKFFILHSQQCQSTLVCPSRQCRRLIGVIDARGADPFRIRQNDAVPTRSESGSTTLLSVLLSESGWIGQELPDVKVSVQRWKSQR
jgi:hypothetical protein